ncbi:hypothetical protein A3732_21925, partial [Oleiphilus sp. HI0050]
MLLKVQTKPKNLVSLTPLIDVVFILLLFFMLTSSFSQFRQIELGQLSQGAHSSAEQNRLLILDRNLLELNGTQYSLSDAALSEGLKDIAMQQSSLIVAALSQVDIQSLVSVL